jgi:hypothetical protein
MTIGETYDLLTNKVKATLTEELDKERLDNKTYPVILSQCLQTIIQVSSQALVAEAQIDLTRAQIKLTEAQKDLVDAQKKETADLIEAKKKNLEAQTAAEAEKKNLYKRQAGAYDDNLRIERAKQYATQIGMVYAGGTKVDAQSWRDSYIFCQQIVDQAYDGSNLPPIP